MKNKEIRNWLEQLKKLKTKNEINKRIDNMINTLSKNDIINIKKMNHENRKKFYKKIQEKL